MSFPKTVRRRLSDEPVRKSVADILEDSPLCSMATIGPRGQAHINTAYFAYSPRLEVFFLSDPTSLHCRNVARNPAMAMTIFDSRQVWGGSDRGMQLFGTCREARGPHRRNAERTYARRFPPYAKWMRGPTAQEKRQAEQLRSYTFYRFVPSRVKILNEPVFGGGVFVVTAIPR